MTIRLVLIPAAHFKTFAAGYRRVLAAKKQPSR
jgi:hypothetical protein